MQKQSLCGLWTMICEDGRAFPSPVPGTVLKTLLDEGQISDPFDGMNETAAKEITNHEYAFEYTFTAEEGLLAHPHADLVFNGLDTLADVILNGTKIASADNMHRNWRFPVKGMLRAGENTLRVVFHPALTAVKELAAKNPLVSWSGSGPEFVGSGDLRKAHYMFSWDWGPCLPDAGIWREVFIEAYTSRIEDLLIRQVHEDGRVILRASVKTQAETLRIAVLDPAGKEIARQTADASAPMELMIDQPRLWWPNGLGEQPLYTVQAEVCTGGIAEDSAEFRIGLRTMTVSRRKDEWGEEFAFCCNGERFFAMGADWIPEDNLITRPTREDTARLLKACRDSNFNCVRVWGGGLYPNDDFYDLCDEMGLVIWQDYMFACNIYRMTDSFRESITAEAVDNVRRIRHHASLGLICGNNEMETGWMGWADVKDHPQTLRWDYLEQFEHVLTRITAQEAPDTFYWPSSPSSGGGFEDPNSLDRGDVHDWSVWHGRQPFSDFTRRFPRFCSEFGFESFPSMEALNTFIHDPRDMNPFSEVMESHQKCLNGNNTMLFYLSQTLRYPFSMEGLVHATQYLQAEAMRAGVEHWRRNRGRCMGAIYWQLNDCWPVASWASIDYLGKWKALQYEAKRFFAPLMISLDKTEQGYAVYVSNERREPFSGKALCCVRDKKGRILREEVFPVECEVMSSVRVGDITSASGEAMPIVQCRLTDPSGAVISENEALYVLPKHFPLETPGIQAECSGHTIRLTADTFCMAVELEAGSALFSDNWVTLYPGETRVITADREISPEQLQIRYLQ